MPGGRPSRTSQQPQPELLELATWFRDALRNEGHETAHAFLSARRPRQIPPPDKNAVYDIVGGKRLRDLETTQRLAAALGQPADSVTPTWKKAKRLLEQKELAERRLKAVPRLGWSDIALPDPWLEDLFRSQARAAEHFPYDLLGVEKPPLSSVFVEQDIQPASAGSSRHALHSSESVSTLAAALSTHDHLFITGGPGSGKTTLGQHLARQIARYWLREVDAEVPWCAEAVVCVRITSADLFTQDAWHQQLSNAISRAGTLVSPVGPERFTQRPHGARWLIVVDGLDEISSPKIRSDILQTLAREVRPNGNCRLVITSRPLRQDELKPFENLPGIGFYALKGFDKSQQLSFAHLWFRAQGAGEPQLQAREFLKEADHAGLRDILQVPLLTTIAAAFRSRNPRSPLPRGRIALYENFLADLRTAREGNSEVVARFRNRWLARGLGDLADWLLTHQDELVTHLAWQSVKNRSLAPRLLEISRSWLDSHLPSGLSWPQGTEAELGQFLAQTGVMAFDGFELSFLHKSFAEFIAAQDEVAGISADFPELEAKSAAIDNAAERNRILFTFALWAREPGNDVTRIVRHLLAGDLQHRIMALRLVTAGVSLGPALEQSVIERLMDFAANDNDYYHEKESQVLSELSQLRGNQRLANHLRLLAQSKGLRSSLRTGAAAAYANVHSLSGGIEMLKEIAETAQPGAALNCCRWLYSLDPTGAEFQIRILRRIVSDCDVEAWYRLGATEQLVTLGDTSGLVEYSLSVVAGTDQSSQVIERFGDVIFAIEGTNAAEKVRDAVINKRVVTEWSLKGLTMTLLRFNLFDEVPRFARRLFDESADDEAIGEVVDAWLDGEGVDAADKIVEIMRDHPAWNSDERHGVARQLLGGGLKDHAAELMRISLDASSRSGDGSISELRMLIDALGVDGTPEILSWCDALQASANDYATVMNQLMKLGAPPHSILSLAKRVLYDPGAGNDAFVSACEAIFRLELSDGCSAVLEALRLRPYSGAALRASLLPVLAEHGEVAAVSELAQELLADPGVTTPELQSVVRAWVATIGRASIGEIMTRVEASVSLTADQLCALADLLDGGGLSDEAARLWCRVCTMPGTAEETRWRALQEVMILGANHRAIQALRQALVAPRDSVESMILRRLLAWLTVED